MLSLDPARSDAALRQDEGRLRTLHKGLVNIDAALPPFQLRLICKASIRKFVDLRQSSRFYAWKEPRSTITVCQDSLHINICTGTLSPKFYQDITTGTASSISAASRIKSTLGYLHWGVKSDCSAGFALIDEEPSMRKDCV